MINNCSRYYYLEKNKGNKIVTQAIVANKDEELSEDKGYDCNQLCLLWDVEWRIKIVAKTDFILGTRSWHSSKPKQIN